MLLLLTLGALADDAVLDAEHVVWDGGVATAAGDVRVELGDDVITGRLATFDSEQGTLRVRDGVWSRGELGTLSFDTAEVDVDTATGTVTGGVFESGSLRVTGERLGWTEERVLTGEQVVYTPCACDGVEPWGVSSRRVEVEPGRRVRFGPGFLQILELPAVPLPGGTLPLRRRSGLMPPRLQVGQDGLIVEAPAYLTLGRSADTTLAPEVRTERGVRAITELRYALRGGAGEIDASGGWDAQEEQARGGARWTHRWTNGNWWTATDGQLTTDPLYDATYRDRFFDRALPFREVRGAVGIGAVQLTTDIFQGAEPFRSELVGLRFRPRTVEHRGLLATADLRVRGIAGGGTDPNRALSTGHAGVFGRLERPTRAGPFMISPRLEVYGRSATVAPLGARWSWASVATDLGLPLWRTTSAFERLEPTVEVGAVASVPVTWDPALDTLPPVGPVWVAPGLLYRRVGEGLLEGRIGLHAAPDGVTARADAAWELGSFSGRAEVRGLDELELGNATLGVGRTLRLDGSWTWLDEDWVGTPVHQVRGAASVGATPLRLSAGLVGDLTGERFLSRTLGLTWTHRSGCLKLGTNARFDSDRAMPDLGLVFDIEPAPRERGRDPSTPGAIPGPAGW